MNIICKLIGHKFSNDYYWLRARGTNRRNLDERCVLILHQCTRCGKMEYIPIDTSIDAWFPQLIDGDNINRMRDEDNFVDEEGPTEIPQLLVGRSGRDR